jgi:tetrahydromethanopterin S-methyltransferase subunit A
LIVAEPSKEWKPDSEGFFVILTDEASGSIICEHYTTENIRNEVIKGTEAVSIYKTAIRRGLLSRLDHAAYLGKELEKAEISLRLGEKYIQDKT